MTDFVLEFPPQFRWGTATAAHQVEGNNQNNQWWVWEHTAQRIQNGDKSGLACNWWQNAEADFDHMAAMHQNAHRLSVEWSRIETRDGVFDSAALERYRAMLLALRQRGVEPMVTLHHFTNPIWLEEQGGWENLELVVPRFQRFVVQVVRTLGDVCDLWCTINEPNVYAVMSYLAGRMPPGKRELGAAVRVFRNMLIAHVAAYQAIHEAQPQARVGLAHHMRVFQGLRRRHPVDNALSHLLSDVFNNSLLMALVQGRWHWLLRLGAPQSAAKLRGTLDWIGLNYYTRQRVMFDHRGGDALFSSLVNTPGVIMSDYDYGEIYPQGMLLFLRQLASYRLPIYVTENGLPDHDDDLRPGFIVQHLRMVWQAIQLGCDVRGYYHWSLVDNFEWNEGWRMRFGLIAVNTATQDRTWRTSAYLYRDIARANALSSAIVCQYTPELQSLFVA